MERRLAAILALDVVGYSRLMAADEAGTLTTLKACRDEIVEPEIEKHGGRVFKLTGDGVLAEFPSVVMAVNCAVAVQRSIYARNDPLPEGDRIVFRTGVNFGDVIVDDNFTLSDTGQGGDAIPAQTAFRPFGRLAPQSPRRHPRSYLP